jgi:hypothetical protein
VPHPALCLPLLRTPVPLTARALLDAWRVVWPDQPEPHVADHEGALAVVVGDLACAVTVVPAPIQGPEVATAAAASWLWPDAARQIEGYAAHAAVFAGPADDPLTPFVANTRLTRAVLAATGALGVYVGGAGMVVDAGTWSSTAREVVDSPLPLWLNVFASQEGRLRRRASVYTAGMGQFGLMDVEAVGSPRDPGELRLWVLDLPAHLVANGGVPNGARVDGRVVRHAPSETGRPGLVYRVEENG